MGAGEVGRYLARSLSADGHTVTMVDSDSSKQHVIEEQLDVGFVLGNGSHVPVLEAAGVDRCELFIAASSSDDPRIPATRLRSSCTIWRTADCN